MAKHFVVNPKKERVSKEAIEEFRRQEEAVLKESELRKIEQNERKISEEDNLKHVYGKVIIKINTDYKNFWTFEDGTKIRYERQFNNFNRNQTEPVNAIVISGEGIKAGAEILIHPNAIHESTQILDYKDSNDNIKYYSIDKDMCFAWYDGEDWKPLPPFAFGLNVFKPYEGVLENMQPTQLKDTLYVLTGELAGKVVKTISFSAYVIIFQNKDGREGQILRFRPFGDGRDREEEAICVLNDITENVKKGKYLVGVSVSDCKKII